jgi:hypothetical protein
MVRGGMGRKMGFRQRAMQRVILAFGFALMLGVAAARAQEPPQTKPALPDSTPEPAPQQPPAPQTTQPLPALQPEPAQQTTQQPGEGTQVRTGSVVGDGSTLAMITRLTTLLGDHQFLEMQALIASDSDSKDTDGQTGKPRLSSEQKQIFQGVIANRENKPEDSIKLLEPLVSKLDSQPAPPPEEKLLRKTLAEDYLRSGNLAKAAQAYQQLQARTGSSLTPDEQDEMELPMKLLPLAALNPPMTVEPGDPFSLAYDRDLLGLLDVPVFIDARSHDWMLDPTAPFNLICRSTAKEIGLKLSAASATVHTITGKPMTVHATLIPRFTIGTITYRNMTAFVFEDRDYYFPRTGYQVRGVLGYPAVSALGSLTITSNAQIQIQPGDKGERLTTGAPFYLDGDRVIVALGKPGEERMFAIDAGGQQTYLSSRYYAEHADDFANSKRQLLPIPGAQSASQPPAPAYIADNVTLSVGKTPIEFHFLQVWAEPFGSAALDDTYGTLGMDALDELKSYTFDYRTMRFSATAR